MAVNLSSRRCLFSSRCFVFSHEMRSLLFFQQCPRGKVIPLEPVAVASKAFCKNEAVYTGHTCFPEWVFLFSVDKPLQVELLDPTVVLFLNFWGNSMLFSTVAAPISNPTNSAQGLPFLHILTSTGGLSIYWWQQLWQVRGDTLWLWFAFPWCWVMLSIFSCNLLAICMSSLAKCVFRFLLPILNWIIIIIFFLLLSCMEYFNVLDINLLLNIWFANVFSHSVGCLSFRRWFPLLFRAF